MFEVGDKVKVKQEARFRIFYDAFRSLPKVYGEILFKKSKNVVFVRFRYRDLINHKYDVDIDDLELVEKKSELKYKVGDKFLVEYEIVESEKDGYLGDFPYMVNSIIGGRWTSEPTLSILKQVK